MRPTGIYLAPLIASGSGAYLSRPHLQTTLQTTIATWLAKNAGPREIERVRGFDRKVIRTCEQRYEAEPANSSGVATGPGGDALGLLTPSRVHRGPGRAGSQRRRELPRPGRPVRRRRGLQQRQALRNGGVQRSGASRARWTGRRSDLSLALDSPSLDTPSVATRPARALQAGVKLPWKPYGNQ